MFIHRFSGLCAAAGAVFVWLQPTNLLVQWIAALCCATIAVSYLTWRPKRRSVASPFDDCPLCGFDRNDVESRRACGSAFHFPRVPVR